MKVVFVGNCQAQTVAATMQAAARGKLECLAIDVGGELDAAACDWIADADVVFDQPIERERVGDLLRDARGPVLRMPLLGARFLWPFVGDGHPRNDATVTPAAPYGLYPGIFVDDQLRALIERHGVGPDAPDYMIAEVVQEYLALDYAELVDLDRMREQQRMLGLRINDDVGGRFVELVMDKFRNEPLFFGVGQLGGWLAQLLCRKLASMIDVAVTPEAAKEAWFDVYGGDEPPHAMAPIHPSVVRHFGLTWLDTPARFRWYYEGFFTVGQIAERAVRLARDEAREVLERGEDAEIGSLAASLHDSPHFRMRRAALLRARGRSAAAAAEYAEAARLLPRAADGARDAALRNVVRCLADPGPGASVRLQYAAPIAFRAGQAGVAALVEGWCEPEQWGCRLRGYCGRLRFAVPPPQGREVTLHLGITAHRKTTRAQSVRVFLNGREVALWRFRHDGNAERTIEAGDWVHESGDAELAFFVAHPAAAADTGADDRRPLSFAVRTLEIRSS